jgi:hypothetical protein
MTITDMKTKEIKSYIQSTLKDYIDKPFTNATIGDIVAYITKQMPIYSPHFKFSIKQNEFNPGKIDIIPHNLYTGVFLQEGLFINPDLTEVETLYGKYTFVNDCLLFSLNKSIAKVKIQVSVKT